MYLHLHRLSVRLESDDAQVTGRFASVFGPWVSPAPAARSARTTPIHLRLSLVKRLPRLPLFQPSFKDPRSQAGGLTVYDSEEGQLQLLFPGEALINVPLHEGGQPERVTIEGRLTASALSPGGRFEDIVYASLAPSLRRHGLFLIHAFAAARPGQALLLSGPSGSGKTTAGTALLLDGWQFLANDVLLLEPRSQGVFALPTPGHIHLRPDSAELLPVSRSRLFPGDGSTVDQGSLLGDPQSAPALVSHIFFPEVGQSEHTLIEPVSRAVCLARLMAESVDRWDRQMLSAHVDLLQRLSRQAAPYRVYLGRDVGQLARMIPVG
jgi:hypothetical protein